jgi:hypothetical protein
MDLIATNINIFSGEMWNVVRKGQWVMTTGDMMTNAMVSEYAQAVNGRTLTMKYDDGTSTIAVPDGIPIHRLVTVKPETLAAGMQIVVRGTAGDDQSVARVELSRDGGTSWRPANDTGGPAPWSSWNCSIALSEGPNNITARAVDIAGLANTTAIAVDVDTVARGRVELLSGQVLRERVRRVGGGRRRAEKKRPKS